MAVDGVYSGSTWFQSLLLQVSPSNAKDWWIVDGLHIRFQSLLLQVSPSNASPADTMLDFRKFQSLLLQVSPSNAPTTRRIYE
jgi:hypothetical protein